VNAPEFIETVGRRGYRFVGTVERDDAQAPPAGTSPPDAREAVPPRRTRRLTWRTAAAGAALAVLVAAGAWHFTLSSPPAPEIRSLAMLPLENLSSDVDQECG
jgi:hypothetical protein